MLSHLRATQKADPLGITCGPYCLLLSSSFPMKTTEKPLKTIHLLLQNFLKRAHADGRKSTLDTLPGAKKASKIIYGCASCCQHLEAERPLLNAVGSAAKYTSTKSENNLQTPVGKFTPTKSSPET